ncbi:hypothetical protein [Streptomyces sp. NBC_01233]|uniref:hypothetical protein n=1 Tax=Streptomyces sp. NBC_01233 TaxID=2903787 RepID=UPI002E16736F|nr:hypothetical protein OG332_02070 [Streptomyces sp. NBC_01233]
MGHNRLTEVGAQMDAAKKKAPQEVALLAVRKSPSMPARVVVPGMISTQQIAGETAALDLMLAHLTHEPEAIASATADSAACPICPSDASFGPDIQQLVCRTEMIG